VKEIQAHYSSFLVEKFWFCGRDNAVEDNFEREKSISVGKQISCIKLSYSHSEWSQGPIALGTLQEDWNVGILKLFSNGT
jgi:hypothetical protein